MIKLRISYEDEKEKLKAPELIKAASKLGTIKKIHEEYKGNKYHRIYVEITT